jgi:hypothetical protein
VAYEEWKLGRKKKADEVVHAIHTGKGTVKVAKDRTVKLAKHKEAQAVK